MVVLHGDFGAQWLAQAQRLGIETLGLHANPFQISVEEFLAFVEQEGGNILRLEEAGVRVEYELHAVNYLLPRSLFAQEQTLFRSNEAGERVADYNGCPSSAKALDIVEKNAYALAGRLQQKSHRYHLWTDDDMGGDVRCHCEKCRKMTANEQNLRFYKAILRGLRKYDKQAELSFLLYGQEGFFEPLPKGLFVEFAPFTRRHDIPIEEGETNAGFREIIQGLLSTYGRERVEVLEYFLSYDYAGFCALQTRVQKDIEYYRALGVERLSTFIVCPQPEYLQKENFQGIEKYMQL